MASAVALFVMMIVAVMSMPPQHAQFPYPEADVRDVSVEITNSVGQTDKVHHRYQVHPSQYDCTFRRGEINIARHGVGRTFIPMTGASPELIEWKITHDYYHIWSKYGLWSDVEWFIKEVRRHGIEIEFDADRFMWWPRPIKFVRISDALMRQCR